MGKNKVAGQANGLLEEPRIKLHNSSRQNLNGCPVRLKHVCRFLCGGNAKAIGSRNAVRCAYPNRHKIDGLAGRNINHAANSIGQGWTRALLIECPASAPTDSAARWIGDIKMQVSALTRSNFRLICFEL